MVSFLHCSSTGKQPTASRKLIVSIDSENGRWIPRHQSRSEHTLGGVGCDLIVIWGTENRYLGCQGSQNPEKSCFQPFCTGKRLTASGKPIVSVDSEKGRWIPRHHSWSEHTLVGGGCDLTLIWGTANRYLGCQVSPKPDTSHFWPFCTTFPSTGIRDRCQCPAEVNFVGLKHRVRASRRPGAVTGSQRDYFSPDLVIQ